MAVAMKTIAVLLVAVCAVCTVGCSNAPVAGFLDVFFPSKPLDPRPTDSRPSEPAPNRGPAADLLPPVGPVGPVRPGN